jgi:hypothetical protein
MYSEQSNILRHLFPYNGNWAMYETEFNIVRNIHLSRDEDDLAVFLVDPDPRVREFAKFKYKFIVKLKQLEGVG